MIQLRKLVNPYCLSHDFSYFRYYNVIVTLFLPILSLCLFRYPSEKTAAGKNHIYKGSVGHPRKLIHQDKISRYIHEGRSCLENKPTRVTCPGKANRMALSLECSKSIALIHTGPHLILNDRQMSSVSSSLLWKCSLTT